jgi:hypothetical protein
MTSTEAQNGFGRVLDTVARHRTVSAGARRLHVPTRLRIRSWRERGGRRPATRA